MFRRGNVNTDGQHERICASVLGSSYFKGKIRYPRTSYCRNVCYSKEVSFQTIDVEKDLGGKYFDEWMIYCEAVTIRSNTKIGYYVSSAYNAAQAFVFNYNSFTQKVYLENLSMNVGISDESFTQ